MYRLFPNLSQAKPKPFNVQDRIEVVGSTSMFIAGSKLHVYSIDNTVIVSRKQIDSESLFIIAKSKTSKLFEDYDEDRSVARYFEQISNVDCLMQKFKARYASDFKHEVKFHYDLVENILPAQVNIKDRLRKEIQMRTDPEEPCKGCPWNGFHPSFSTRCFYCTNDDRKFSEAFRENLKTICEVEPLLSTVIKREIGAFCNMRETCLSCWFRRDSDWEPYDRHRTENTYCRFDYESILGNAIQAEYWVFSQANKEYQETSYLDAAKLFKNSEPYVRQELVRRLGPKCCEEHPQRSFIFLEFIKNNPETVIKNIDNLSPSERSFIRGRCGPYYKASKEKIHDSLSILEENCVRHKLNARSEETKIDTLNRISLMMTPAFPFTTWTARYELQQELCGKQDYKPAAITLDSPSHWSFSKNLKF